ncbi:MAG: adenylate/guanylate cyclase domain-containing protein [Bacteroidota bacterium]
MMQLRYLMVLVLMLSGLSVLQAQAPSDSVLEADELLARAKQSNISVDSAIILVSKALLISQDESYEDGLLRSYWQMASLYRQQEAYTQSLRYQLQLIPLLIQNKDTTALYEAYLNIGDIYQAEKLYEQALLNFRKAQMLTDKEIEVWERMEMSFSLDEKPDSALFLLDLVYDFYDDQDDVAGQINTIERQIVNYIKQENYTSSLEKNQILLELVASTDDDNATASVYNNLGYTYLKLGQPQRALEHFQLATVINDGEDSNKDATLHINMAICYQNMGQIEAAVQYLKTAQSMLPNEATERQVAVHLLIAKLYLGQGDFYNALLYNQLAEEQATYIGSAVLLSDAYRQAGQINEALFEYQTALTYFSEHLQIEDSLQTIEKLRQQQLLQQQLELERAEKEIRIYQINEALKDAELQQTREERRRLEVEKDNLLLQAQEQTDQLALLEKDKSLQAALLKARDLESEQTFLLLREQLKTEARERELTELQQQEEMQSMKLLQVEADQRIRDQQIAALERQQDLKELQLTNQRRSSQLAYGIGAGLLLISSLVFINLYRSRRANKRLENKNKEVIKERKLAERERRKSDELLLNILPGPTAAELKDKGKATPKKYDLATVIFTDFSGFTSVSELLSPDELIRELNGYFSAFDRIMDKYALEKIKTLGDGYMGVGGVPIADEDNPVRVVKAALEIQAFMSGAVAEKKAAGIPYWEMRVGINSGSLVAGVIGEKKFAYDVWGDTVNIASRMESHGEVGKVNISQHTYDLVKDHFDCQARGKHEVKNVGMMEMYFVKGGKEES